MICNKCGREIPAEYLKVCGICGRTICSECAGSEEFCSNCGNRYSYFN